MVCARHRAGENEGESMIVLAVLMAMCGLLSAIAGLTVIIRADVTWPQVGAAGIFMVMGLAFMLGASAVIR